MASGPTAAEKAAPKKDAFAEPEHSDQRSELDALTPEESLANDQRKAKVAEDLRKLNEKQDKDLEEVRKINRENKERAYNHGRTEVSAVVYGIKDPSDKSANADAQDGPGLSVWSGDGRVHVKGDVVLDREATIQLRAILNEAFQAVA